jgi:alkylated DNA nucleotide flippase Atl1
MNANLRATQIWPVLAWAAMNRQTMTYGMLGKLIGVPARGLGNLLEPIQAYCVQHELPPLTALVVSSTTGMPGTGFTAASEVPKALQDVFSFDWLESGGAPSAEAFEASVEQSGRN